MIDIIAPICLVMFEPVETKDYPKTENNTYILEEVKYYEGEINFMMEEIKETLKMYRFFIEQLENEETLDNADTIGHV